MEQLLELNCATAFLFAFNSPEKSSPWQYLIPSYPIYNNFSGKLRRATKKRFLSENTYVGMFHNGSLPAIHSHEFYAYFIQSFGKAIVFFSRQPPAVSWIKLGHTFLILASAYCKFCIPLRCEKQYFDSRVSAPARKYHSS
jgi:hypothetical protein